MTDVVEAMHRSIARLPWAPDASSTRTRGLTGLVYRSIRSITGWVGSGADVALTQLQPLLDKLTAQAEGPARDALVAALNGVLGDHLAATGNPLALPMEIRCQGRVLPHAEGERVLLLIHGLCMDDAQWQRRGHDHGAALARDLGYRRAYLRYNSGLHVSTNGRELAQQLERWIADAPQEVTELAIVGYSLGGLVARSACHYAATAGYRWPRALKHLVFLGTPHLGAPLERGGNWLDLALGMTRYSAPLATLGRMRSAGITDLRHGSLLDEDWHGIDRFERNARLPQPIPLPSAVSCAAIAASTGQRADDLGDRLLGDGLVPVASALGQHADPARALTFAPERQWIGYGMNHLDLLDHADVRATLHRLLAPSGGHTRRDLGSTKAPIPPGEGLACPELVEEG
ncbi:hypothetical protein [Dokdonella soli]|uniref:esterase/lipase family protein n=1 Tax=Dokdonella soli TaxID=529810 RepID=UPI0031D9C97D